MSEPQDDDSAPLFKLADLKNILKHFEDDYKEDLGIHLYSVHLMHTQSLNFPPKEWTSWPLDPVDVPDPSTLDDYVDEPEIDRELRANEIREPEDNRWSEELAFSSDEENDKNREDSDPAKIMELEIERLYKRKIYHAISEKGHHIYGTEPTVDELRAPPELSGEIMKKIDTMMSQFRCNKMVSRNLNKSLFTWSDILLQSGVKDPKFLQRMKSVFVDEADTFMQNWKSEQDSDYDDTMDDTQDDITDVSPIMKKDATSEIPDEQRELIKRVNGEPSQANKMLELRRQLSRRLLEYDIEQLSKKKKSDLY
jgi:hypothetical protein